MAGASKLFANETMTDEEAFKEEVENQPPQPVEEPVAEPPPPAAESPAEGGGEPAEEKASANRPGVVALDRFNEVLADRNRLRQENTEAREMRERWARLEERQRLIQEQEQQRQVEAQRQQQLAERPDQNIDPVGAQLWDIQQQNQAILARYQQQEQQNQQLQATWEAQRQTQEFNNWIVQEANTFTREHPDYPEAAKAAAEWRMNWFQSFGVPAEQAREVVLREVSFLANAARATGKSFIPAVYELGQAIRRIQAGQAPANGKGAANGAAVPVAANPQAALNANRLDQARRGQALQGVGRVPAAGNEGKSRYRDMSVAEFSNVSDAQWARDWADPQTRREMEYKLKQIDGLLDDETVSYSGRGER